MIQLIKSCLILLLAFSWFSQLEPGDASASAPSQEITVTELEPREMDPIADLQDLEQAVVRIDGFGLFVDPIEDPAQKATGRGAGFIIDPAGIAVTNNHVVAGAAFLQVNVAGEAEPRNARVLGVSECADLAVIDIAGDGYPYLAWAEEAPESGESVYVGGYVLNADGTIGAYELAEGRTSVVETSIGTNWVSVQGALQHNGPNGPGYAGGPLVNANGQIVGVSYAGESASNQSFALTQESAQALVAQLQERQNVDAIGINGQIVRFLDGSYGVWVGSVRAGSPADDLGLEGGDIIVSVLDFALTGDQTMATYCNILRSNDSQQVLPLQVIRFATNELLEGQINGVPLAVRSSFADDLTESIISLPSQANFGQTALEQTSAFESSVQTGSSAQAGSSAQTGPDVGFSQVGGDQSEPAGQPSQEQALYSDFSPFTDDSGTITLELPDEWNDISNGEWVEGGETIGVYISASTDLNDHFDAWYSDWDTAGVFFGYSRQLVNSETPDGWLDSIDLSADCSYDGRSQLPAEGYFSGYFDVWGSCGNTDSIVLVVAATPPEEDYIFVIETLSVTRADLLVVDHILDTFRLNLPGDSSQETLGTLLKRQVDTSEMIYEYEFVANDAGNALLPSTWSDSAIESWIVDDEEIGPSFAIAPDVSAFQNGWDVPGVWVRSSTDLADEIDVDGILDSLRFSESCTYDDRYDHEHTIFDVEYVSRYDLWTDCGETDSILAVVATQSTAPEQFALIEFQAVTDADAEAFGVYLNSFFLGDGPTELEDENEANLAETVTNAEESEPAISETDNPAYVNVTDETGTLKLLVPTEWTDVSSGEWIVDGDSYGLSLSASTDLEAYYEGWETPGVFMGVSRELAALDPDAFLEFFEFEEECTYGEQFLYETDAYEGLYDVWEDCGDIPGVYAVLAVKPVNEVEPLIMLNVLSTNRSEVALFEEVLGNFSYDMASLDLMAEGRTLVEDSDAAGDEEANESGEDTSDSDSDDADAEPIDLDVVDVDVADVDVTAPDEPTTETVISRVTVRALNVRSGPTVNNPRVDSVFTGALLTTIGQVNNCAWLQVVTPDGIVGWVSGSSEYVTIDGDCAQLPEIDPDISQDSADSNAEPEPAPTSTPEPDIAESNDDADGIQDGCFLFQNELNAEVTVTLTRQGVQWNQTFLMQPDEEREECFEPGDYTYTLDAPPPWGSTNGELEINSGDRFYFPIRSE